MWLFYSPFHTFVHKVLVTAHECGHWDRLKRVPTFPFKNNAGKDQGDAYDISALNPLDKLEGDAARDWDSFDVGHAAMLHAISYLGFRAEFFQAKDPVHPNSNRREGRPSLSAW